MSTNNYTAFLLDLKDPNLNFTEENYREEIIKGITTKIITATLKNKPQFCPHCGCNL